MQRNITKSLVITISVAILVFVMGFGTIYRLWLIGSYNPELPGLFDYRAATYGDGICLPLLVASLTFVKLLHDKPSKKWLMGERIITSVAGVIGIIIQYSWLKSDNTALNWTIPKLHNFNTAGWYHAFFFVCMFALLGNLFLRYIYVKFNENEFDESVYSILVQTVIWFSSSWFLFLHITDDYLKQSNKFNLLVIMLGINLVISLIIEVGLYYFFCNSIKLKNIIPVLSGTMSAYGLINIMLKSVEIDIFYLISCALLIIILVVPDIEHYRNMAIMYFIIAIPTLLLEASISVQGSVAHMLFVFLLALLTPCVIALCQKDKTGFNILRKGIFASIIILVYISLLVIVFVLRDNSDYSELFEMLLNFVLVYAVPMYVKSTFKQIIEAEDQNDLEKVRKLQPIMYTLYFCVYSGTVILILRALFPDIHWYRSGELLLEKTSILGYLMLLFSCTALFVISHLRKGCSRRISRLCTCLMLLLGYISLILILTPTVFGSDELNYDVNNKMIIILLSLFVWIGYPTAISLGFRSNIATIRGEVADIWVNGVSILIFGGSMIGSIFAEYMMFYYNTVSAIIINCIFLFIGGIVLPYLVGEVLTKRNLHNQVAKNKPTAGVVQDGILYGMLAILSELLTVFFIGELKNNQMNFAEVTGLIISGAVYLSVMTWPLDYCINNNIDHFKKRKNECEEGNINKEVMITALLKHLRMQNIIALIISFPYSLYLVISKVFEYGLGDENNIRSLIAKVLPGIDYDNS